MVSLVRAATHPDGTCMFLHHPQRDPESQAGSTLTFGGEKRLEQMATIPWCDTWSVVCYRDSHAFPTAIVPIPRAKYMDDHSAVIAHRLQGIYHQIGKDLAQLPGIALHGSVNIVLARKLDPGLV